MITKHEVLERINEIELSMKALEIRLSQTKKKWLRERINARLTELTEDLIDQRQLLGELQEQEGA